MIAHLIKQKDMIHNEYDPDKDKEIMHSDPRKTIFVGRLSFETDENTIKK